MNASMSQSTGQPQRKRVTIERVLLVMVLAMQTAIFVRMGRLVQTAKEASPGPAVEHTLSDTRGAVTSESAEDHLHDAGVLSPPPSSFLFAPWGREDEFDRFFSRALGDFERLHHFLRFDSGWDRVAASPTLDMRDDKDRYVVTFSVPGISAEDIRVNLDGRILTVSAVDRIGSGSQILRTQVLLPGPVQRSDDVQAVLTNNLLSVSLPKTP